MDSNPLDAALSDEPVAATTEDAPAEAPAPSAAPDGKFTTAVPVTRPSEPAPAPPEPGHVPISAMLDEREKRQRLERELEQLRGQQAPPPPLQPAEQLQLQRYQDNLRFSRRFAEREYGKEVIAEVHDWAAARCDADPAFNEQMKSSDDPYEAAYQAFNREKVLAAVSPADLEAFNAWKRAQAEVQAHQAPTHQPTASAPPRSLATAPGNGAAGQAHIPVGDGEAFRSLFTP